MPITILSLAGIALAVLHRREQPFIEVISLGIGLLTLVALMLWFIFLTGLRWPTRWVLLAIVGALGAGAYYGIKHLTRVEGSIGGSGVPRLVWKWSPKKDAEVSPLVVASPEQVSSSTPPASRDSARDYPQFLGPDRLGILTGYGLARDWQVNPPRQLWRQPIGLGWSAFAVQGGRAITQEQRQEQELTVCYDLLTGVALWAHTNLARFSESLGGDGPRATPTIREDRAYVMGATGILDCLDLATGQLIWSRDVLRENQLGNITWGKSCSPLWIDGRVVVTGGEPHQKSLLAYNAADGTPLWQAGDDRASYASPFLGVMAGQPQILIVNGGSVASHDPSSGLRLWHYAWPGGFPKVTQPLVVDPHRVLIAAGYGLGAVMLKVGRAEDGAWTAEELWKSRNLKPKFTNLVRHGNHVYGLDDGILVCMSLEDGKREWKDGRYGHGQILLVDDLLLVQAESGAVVLVEATPEQHRELTRFQAIQGKTWNHPVLVDDLLLVRNDQEAACYRLPRVQAP
jgi:outer membrane protein assembly factor BamB